MNCAIHTDTPAAAYCRTCGKALCENCKREVMGAIYCEPCIAARLQGAPVGTVGTPAPAGSPPSSGGTSPGLAAILGMIPGVGAMYNGQFMKAFIHVLIFALLMTLSEHTGNVGDTMFGLFAFCFWFYMVFDAYKTAEARLRGVPLPDFIGLNHILAFRRTNLRQRRQRAFPPARPQKAQLRLKPETGRPTLCTMPPWGRSSLSASG